MLVEERSLGHSIVHNLMHIPYFSHRTFAQVSQQLSHISDYISMQDKPMPTINHAIFQLLSAFSLVEIRVDIREPLSGVNIWILVPATLRDSGLCRIVLIWLLRKTYSPLRPWYQAVRRITTKVLVWVGDN